MGRRRRSEEVYQELAEQGQDVIQDLVDAFWNHPLPLLVAVHHSNRAEMVDIFAERIYGSHLTEGPGLRSLRRLLGHEMSGGDRWTTAEPVRAPRLP